MTKVLTGGKFNHIHPGHVYLLKKSKSLGDFLVVVLAHGRHNKRPYAKPAKQRKKALEKLGIADKVVVGYPDNSLKTVYGEKPDIIALGYDQKLPADVTEEALERLKIKVVRLSRYKKYSTRKYAGKN